MSCWCPKYWRHQRENHLCLGRLVWAVGSGSAAVLAPCGQLGFLDRGWWPRSKPTRQPSRVPRGVFPNGIRYYPILSGPVARNSTDDFSNGGLNRVALITRTFQAKIEPSAFSVRHRVDWPNWGWLNEQWDKQKLKGSPRAQGESIKH